MTDILLEPRRSDFLASAEQPHNTVLVALPTVDVPNINEVSVSVKKVRLAMHTDNMRILLSALSYSPKLPQLRIEGRIISDQQFEELKRHPVYQFYMNSRLQRASSSDQQDVLVCLFPDNLGVDQQEASRLLELPFSPSTLSSKLGFRTGYFDARKLVEKWQTKGAVNDFLPQFGGVNEFRIGSDSLSTHELEQEAARIARRFQDEQALLLSAALIKLNPLINLSSAGLYNPLILSKFPSKDNINFSKPIYNWKK